MVKTPVNRILVPVDFSECSRAVLEHASFFQKRFGGQIAVVHVVTHVPELEDGEAFLNAFAGESPDSFREHAKTRARQELELLLSTVSDLDVRQSFVELGRPADAILKAAGEVGADLIVMGTHGRSGLERVAMGSVAEHVLRQARCPVLTVRSPAKEQQNAEV